LRRSCFDSIGRCAEDMANGIAMELGDSTKYSDQRPQEFHGIQVVHAALTRSLEPASHMSAFEIMSSGALAASDRKPIDPTIAAERPPRTGSETTQADPGPAL
jgi:hypothetical protein